MEHKKFHSVLEFVDKSGQVADNTDRAVNFAARGIAASQAFRKYSWINSEPIKNIAGNFRGMVVNPDAKIVYNFTVKYGKPIERFNTFATVAVALADSAEQSWDIVSSKDTLDIKGAKLATQATAVAMNVLTGVVTAPVHLALLSMQGYCDITDLARGDMIGSCGQTLKAIDGIIDSSAKQVSDGNNIYHYVNTVINPRVSKALGF